MKRLVFLVGLYLCVAIACTAQQRTYLHSDAADYYCGDRIWFKVYVLDALSQRPSYDDKYVYVELFSPAGEMSQRIRVLQRDSVFAGYMDIPSDAEGGVYQLRAYTRYMKAHSDCIGSQSVHIYSDRTSRTNGDDIWTGVTSPDHNDQTADTLVGRGSTMSVRVGSKVADMSVAVIDELAMPRHRPASIVSTMLSRQSWCRDSALWTNITHETTASIGGRVTAFLSKKPIPNAQVNLILPEYKIYAGVTADSLGYFRFDGVDVPNGTKCILSASRPNGNENVEIHVDETTYPPFSTLNTSAPNESHYANRITYDTTHTIALNEIEVTAQDFRESKRERQLVTLADVSFGEKKIKEYDATCLHDLLRRVPGVSVRDDKCYIRTSTSIYGDNPAAIAVNGVILEGDYDLDLIAMQDIARVDVFKSGTTVIWGWRGGSGVISIILKDGREVPMQSADKACMSRVTLFGFQQPQTFSVIGEQTPRTIFWEPRVKDGRVTFQLWNRVTRYRLVVEGINPDGTLIHRERVIETVDTK